LIVSKRHSIQDVAESLANFQGRNFLDHVPTVIVALVAYVKEPPENSGDYAPSCLALFAPSREILLVEK
jgi:hypothetical protein